MEILAALQVVRAVRAEGITTGPILAIRLPGHLLHPSPCPPIIVPAAHHYSPRLLVHEVGLLLDEMVEEMGHTAGLHRAVAIRSICHTTGRRPVIKGTIMGLHMGLHMDLHMGLRMGIATILHRIIPADLLLSNTALRFVPTIALRRRTPVHSAFPRIFQVFLQSYPGAKQGLAVWILLLRSDCSN